MKESKTKKTTADPNAAASATPGVDLTQVERVLKFMSSHNLEEFEYEHAGLHIRLKRAIAGRAAAPSHAPAEVTGDAPAAPAPAAPSGQPESAPKKVQAEEELHVIKSPIVGTFYVAAGPDVAPFVKVGDSIQAGQVVCIVEAMKLMNEIEADTGGEIVGILAENGQPVEYGQPLFALRPAKKKR